MLYNYHTHTVFCDGKDTPEEMVKKAIELGFSELGFSGHAYVACDEESNMLRDGTKQYKAEVKQLKEKYKDKHRYHTEIVEYDWSDTYAN